MAGQTLKSVSITNLDATPPVRNSVGNAFGDMISIADYVSPGATDDTTSIYKLCRVPSNIVLRHLWVESHGTITTLTGDFTIYFSDVTIDFTGSSAGDTGLVNSLNGTNALFAHSQVMATADTPTDVLNKNAKYDVSKRNQPLWQVAGLSSDPGGFFDIVFLPTSVNSLTAGAVLGVNAEGIIPYR